MAGSKVIHDCVYGSVKVEDVFLELLERPEMQRMHGVHQLGLAHFVFPGANHTRLEHSLGTYHMASLMARALDLPEDEGRTLLAAALLHDIGHAPFSHTLEEIVHDRSGKDHMDTTTALIRGELPSVGERAQEVLGPIRPIIEVLESNGISSDEVCELIVASRKDPRPGQALLVEGGQAHFGTKRYLSQIISGPLDVDQMDYLKRDAYYTGVAHGTIDVDRLLQTVAVFHGDLVISKNGLAAAEGLMVARALMYTSVYYHKTARIAELMLCKAVEHAPHEVMGDAHLVTDCELASRLKACGGATSRVMTLLDYRRLYKKTVMLPVSGLTDEQLQRLVELSEYRRRKEKEREIAERAGVDESEVLLDIPNRSLLLCEPRIGKTDIPILEGDRVRPLSRYSPLAKAIQSRGVHDWAVMVSTPPRNKEEVERAALKALFG
ncbi:MAG: HD domain-containing protein [Methanomassiliicoccus sp.]|nr:HD domain-containing protein [Methanomassiliicoccus sp.]